jgi:sugar phosphate isomerase/epimerase
MKIGASTANFYPQSVEEALDTVLAAGFRTVEVFVNAPSEREPAFTRELRRRADAAGAAIVAYHPYSSFTEPYYLFSEYARRTDDSMEDYKRHFEAAAQLGASYLVLHGDRISSPLSVEESVDRFERLYEIGLSQGVRLAQENVVRYRSQDLAYLRAIRERLGERAAFVLDIKQTVRCGLSVEAVADAMGDSIVHVHISDHTKEQDCLPPGKGTFDYARLFRLLKERHYQGDLIIELYRAGFGDPADLSHSAEFLKTLL